jgi:hypothetical protein
MSQTIERACQWQDCTDNASRHVTYNYQVGEIFSPSEWESRIPISVHHANLCNSHLSELQERFHDVHDMDLGACANTCPVQ